MRDRNLLNVVLTNKNGASNDDVLEEVICKYFSDLPWEETSVLLNVFFKREVESIEILCCIKEPNSEESDLDFYRTYLRTVIYEPVITFGYDLNTGILFSFRDNKFNDDVLVLPVEEIRIITERQNRTESCIRGYFLEIVCDSITYLITVIYK